MEITSTSDTLHPKVNNEWILNKLIISCWTPWVSGSCQATNTKQKLAFCLLFDRNAAWTWFLTKYSEFDILPQFSSLRFRHQPVTQNRMSLKMECHSKRNVSWSGMSLKIECPSIWNVTQNGIYLKMECHSKQNVSQNGMSLKIECHPKWNVTKNGMSLKMYCHSKRNVTQNRISLKMEFTF